MNLDFAAAMREAVRSVRTSNLAEATRIIQDALGRRPADAAPGAAAPDGTPARPAPQPELRLAGPGAGSVAPPRDAEPPSPRPHPAGDGDLRTVQRLRRPLGEVLKDLRQGRLDHDAFGSLPGLDISGTKRGGEPQVPHGARFLARSFGCDAGTRAYKLYVPASAPDRPRGLVVMLHGCKQDPDDFAAGTGMNIVAEAHGLLVAYPSQTRTANSSSCWNWFNPADQKRDAGEPAIIAGITRDIASEFGLGRGAIFVAGLSAGGAMAAVMGETYPDLYAALGIHSGLAYGSANDVMSAFAAMRGDAGPASPAASAARRSPGVPTIVFQGSADRTVHPSNADRIVAAASPTDAASLQQDRGRSDGGRAYTRRLAAGLEYWLVEGAGHAWSGGNPGGSYTDPQGPDASAEMVRFFLDQPEQREAS